MPGADDDCRPPGRGWSKPGSWEQSQLPSFSMHTYMQRFQSTGVGIGTEEAGKIEIWIHQLTPSNLYRVTGMRCIFQDQKLPETTSLMNAIICIRDIYNCWRHGLQQVARSYSWICDGVYDPIFVVLRTTLTLPLLFNEQHTWVLFLKIIAD